MEAKIVRHGEVIMKPVSELPKGAEMVKEAKEYVVAHSETGHHHVLSVKDKTDFSKIKIYSWNGETYIEVPQIAELWHQKSGKDVHTPHKIAPSFYKIIIKKSYDYFQKAMTRVRD